MKRLFRFLKAKKEIHKRRAQSTHQQLNNSTILLHALSTPVTNIRLLVERGLKLSSAEKVRKHLSRISVQIERIESIVSSFSGVGNPQSTRIKPLLAEAVRYIEKKDHSYHLVMHDSLDVATACIVDGFAFVESMLCLLNNAFQSYEDDVEHKLVLIFARKHDAKLQVSIVDFGGGMSEAVKKQFMHASFSTKKNGMGIGVNFALQTVFQAKGSFSFTTKQKTGTTITITLPISD